MTSGPADAVEVRFERADASHADVLVGLMREFYAYEHLPWDEAAARRGLAAILDDGGLGEVWLARTGEGWAGYFVLAFSFSLEFHGRFGFLDELYLRESERGRGLGRRAVDHAAQVCRAQGIRALRLEVTCDNAAARAFYARLGFHDQGRDLLTRWVDVGAADGEDRGAGGR